MGRRLVTLLVIASFATFVLAFAGCGGDDSSASQDTTTTETTTTEDTETTETETTETEGTETTETTDTETTASGDFATSENCQEFASIGAKISGAFTGSSNVQDVEDAFNQLAAAAPDEIKDDFTTLADYFGQLAGALEGYDPSSGQAPSAEALAKIQAIDSAGATAASQNIATWAQENCTG